MLATWKYADRDTLVQRFDIRSRLIFYACFLVSVLLFWDLRFLLLFLALALATVFAARLSWRETRRTWILITAVIATYAALTLVTSRGGMSPYQTERVIVSAQAPFDLLGWRPMIAVSVESLFYALSQFVRVFSITALTILIPYTFDPALYGIAFHQLGLPDKLAFALDLTLRFVPSLGHDFNMTMDAQKARGYELERRQGSLFGYIRRLAPLLVPVVIHSIVSGEEITDAMDLRAFGTGPRTWLRELKYARRDYALIALSLLMMLGAVALSLAGFGRFWTP